ncbi:MAG: polysaccharide lyase [Coleofasciculaceae cyanobacterium]
MTMQLGHTRRLTALSLIFVSSIFLPLTLTSCAQSSSNLGLESSSSVTDSPENTMETDNPIDDSTEIASSSTNATLWSNEFATEDWQKAWEIKSKGKWGLENTTVIEDLTGKFAKVLRVNYPASSASPSVSRKHDLPLGGAGFYGNLGMSPKDSLRLSYYVRFSENFNFVKGGKLPGLFGGSTANGGNIPDGTDGFSTRFMWRRQGDGELYAYLPTSNNYGTSIGRGNWQFQPGVWHHLEQEVILNEPGQENGRVRVWVDGTEVLEEDGLTFRSVDELKLEGIFFSTFFGGGDPSWGTPKDVYVDFAEFSVTEVAP